jgi:3-hydroxyacyl-CoA dehydrogenase
VTIPAETEFGPLFAAARVTDADALTRVVFLGGSVRALELSVALARGGTDVWLVEPDPHDAERLTSILARADARVRVSATMPDAPIGLICDAAGELAPPPEDRLAPTARLTPGPGADMVLDLHRLPDLPPLLEIGLSGALPDTLPRALAAALGACLALRTGTGPSPAARLQGALWRTADDLVLRGAVPWEIDEDMEDAGFAIGPYAAQDQDGLDRALDLRRLLAPADCNPILPRAHAEGRIGRALGWGWYRYPGGGGRVIDPLIEDLAREEARFARIAPDPMPRAAILARLQQVMIAEMQALAQDGVSPGAIALAARLGLGWPQKLALPQNASPFIR